MPVNRPILTAITRTTLTADICKKLAGHLMRGDWAEGERIPAERELGQQLGVGRASLREALKALEIMGMIESRLGEGTFVCKRSEFLSRPLLWAIAGSTGEDAIELIEARRLIEVELAGLAAERASPEDLSEMGEYIEIMEEEADRDPVRFGEADINFHLAIARATHNRILPNALQLIRNLMQQWIESALSVESAAHEAVRQHRRIFEAIVARDPEAARASMRDHLNAMGKRFLEALKSGKPQPRRSSRPSLAVTKP